MSVYRIYVEKKPGFDVEARSIAADLRSGVGIAPESVRVINRYDAEGLDAQLFDYDISPNLSLNIEPQIYYDLQQQQKSAELKLAIQF